MAALSNPSRAFCVHWSWSWMDPNILGQGQCMSTCAVQLVQPVYVYLGTICRQLWWLWWCRLHSCRAATWTGPLTGSGVRNTGTRVWALGCAHAVLMHAVRLVSVTVSKQGLLFQGSTLQCRLAVGSKCSVMRQRRRGCTHLVQQRFRFRYFCTAFKSGVQLCS